MPAPQERLSPDGQYRLSIKPVETRPGCWNHLEIEVYRTRDDALVGRTFRNYPVAHLLQFVEQDGVDYLVLSENYHGGYGVMNLHTGEKSLFDPSRLDHPKGTPFWCWAAVAAHDPNARTLTISGCYWACPYDRITFDFSRPLAPPYAILSVEPDPEEEDGEDQD